MMRLVIFYMLIAMLILAACGGDDDEPVPEAQPQDTEAAVQAPPTARPTRIVTLTPVPEPSATPRPTLSFDVLPYEGEWNLILRYTITDGDIVEQLEYNTSAPVNIDFEGVVSGDSDFKVLPTGRSCLVTYDAENLLSFTLSGEIIPGEDGETLNLNIVPDDPEQTESFQRTCFDALTGVGEDETLSGTVLWDILRSVGGLQHTFFLGTPFQRANEFYDLAEVTNGRLSGDLEVDIYFGR